MRFDVYAKNSKQVFDIEIQTTNKPDLAKRARYYQSVIDMDALQSGIPYGKLLQEEIADITGLSLDDVKALSKSSVSLGGNA